jgi:hypothetical protein
LPLLVSTPLSSEFADFLRLLRSSSDRNSLTSRLKCGCVCVCTETKINNRPQFKSINRKTTNTDMERSRPSLIMSRMYSVSPSQRDFKKAGSKLLPKSRFPGNFKLSPAICLRHLNSIQNETGKFKFAFTCFFRTAWSRQNSV